MSFSAFSPSPSLFPSPSLSLTPSRTPSFRHPSGLRTTRAVAAGELLLQESPALFATLSPSLQCASCGALLQHSTTDDFVRPDARGGLSLSRAQPPTTTGHAAAPRGLPCETCLREGGASPEYYCSSACQSAAQSHHHAVQCVNDRRGLADLSFLAQHDRAEALYCAIAAVARGAERAARPSQAGAAASRRGDTLPPGGAASSAAAAAEARHSTSVGIGAPLPCQPYTSAEATRSTSADAPLPWQESAHPARSTAADAVLDAVGAAAWASFVRDVLERVLNLAGEPQPCLACGATETEPAPPGPPRLACDCRWEWFRGLRRFLRANAFPVHTHTPWQPPPWGDSCCMASDATSAAGAVPLQDHGAGNAPGRGGSNGTGAAPVQGYSQGGAGDGNGSRMYAPAGVAEGLAVYARGGLLNHACVPTALAGVHAAGDPLRPGAVLHVRAVRALAPGEEVTILYDDRCGRSASWPIEARRALLQSTFGFECRCHACEAEYVRDETGGE